MIGDYDNFIFDKDGTQTFNYLNFDYIKNIYDENEKENNDTNGEIWKYLWYENCDIIINSITYDDGTI